MTSPCPICKKPSDAREKPFCSERCRNVDMHRWFTGAYAVPAAEQDETDEAAMEAALTRADSDTPDA